MIENAKRIKTYNNSFQAYFKNILVNVRSIFKTNTSLFILLLIFIGVLLAIRLYWPFLDRVINNKFAKSYGSFNKKTLFETMPLVFHQFLSARYLLIPIILYGMVNIIRGREQADGRMTRRMIFCSIVLILPFIVSSIRGDRPFQRVFLNLSIVFAILISTAIYYAIASIPKIHLKKGLLVMFIFVYCSANFVFEARRIDDQLMIDIIKGEDSSFMYYPYFRAHYSPSKLLKAFRPYYDKRRLPLIIHRFDAGAFPAYLKKYKYKYSRGRRLSLFDIFLSKHEECYAISTRPNDFELMIKNRHPRYQYERINEDISYHNIYLLSKNNSKE